jgi:L-serine dehydratase
MVMTLIKKIPSIFNDVIGPVMRGPSSSHCAAAVRIGKIARDLMDGEFEEIMIEFDPSGSLATTHESQGSDMGLFGGFLGWDASDERLPGSVGEIKKSGIKINIRIHPYGATHPNTYKMTFKNRNEQHAMTAISTGGGMIEIIEIDGVKLSMGGDFHETLIYLSGDAHELINYLSTHNQFEEILYYSSGENQFIQIKSAKKLEERFLTEIQTQYRIHAIKQLSPVLPVLSRRELTVPFQSCEDMLKYNRDKNLQLWELALHYESARGNLSHDEVFQEMRNIVMTMRNSIDEGLKGTEYAERVLSNQSANFQKLMGDDKLLDGGMLNLMILYVTAIMEVKSSMGVIVAAPTAGACAALPGACIAAAESMKMSIDDMTKAMLAAGVTGIFIATHSTFAAEVGGCQAEGGSGAGMAAAALVTLAGGTVEQAIAASSMALQNMLGLICDPVANRVEVPCLGKNVIAASNALACANMALSDFDPVIPLDEVIETMDRVGRQMPCELRCTALGGLSITKTSREIEKRLSESKKI